MAQSSVIKIYSVNQAAVFRDHCKFYKGIKHTSLLM